MQYAGGQSSIRRESNRERRGAMSEEIRRAREARGNRHNRNNVSDLWNTWIGVDAFVCGTGTSLNGFRWEILNDRPNSITIALNDAVKASGFRPNFHLFSDIGIWKRYWNLALDKRTAVVCQRRARDQFIRTEGCKFKDQVFHFNHVSVIKGLKENDDSLFVSRTVATGGICLAWKLGARRIFLLGVDGYKKRDAYYWDGSQKPPERRREKELEPGLITQDRHEWWQKNMRELREYFDVRKLFPGPYPEAGIYNLSAKSTIDAWEKVPLEEVLGKGAFLNEQAHR